MPNPYRKSNGQFASKGAGGGGGAVGRRRKGGRALSGSIKRSTSKVGKTARTQNRNSIQLGNRALASNNAAAAAGKPRRRMAGTSTKGRLPTGTVTSVNGLGGAGRRTNRRTSEYTRSHQYGNRMLVANRNKSDSVGRTRPLRSVASDLKRSNAALAAGKPRRRMAGTKSTGLLSGRNVAHGEWQNSGTRWGGIERIGGNTIYRGTVYGRNNSGKKGRWLKKGVDIDQRYVTRDIAASGQIVAANRAMARGRKVVPTNRWRSYG